MSKTRFHLTTLPSLRTELRADLGSERFDQKRLSDWDAIAQAVYCSDHHLQYSESWALILSLRRRIAWPAFSLLVVSLSDRRSPTLKFQVSTCYSTDRWMKLLTNFLSMLHLHCPLLTVVDDHYWTVRASPLFQVLMLEGFCISDYSCGLGTNLVADTHSTERLQLNLE